MRLNTEPSICHFDQLSCSFCFKSTYVTASTAPILGSRNTLFFRTRIAILFIFNTSKVCKGARGKKSHFSLHSYWLREIMS